jgi:hypothetical protein
MIKELGYDDVDVIRLLKIGTFAGSCKHIAESAQGENISGTTKNLSASGQDIRSFLSVS